MKALRAGQEDVKIMHEQASGTKPRHVSDDTKAVGDKSAHCRKKSWSRRG